MTVLVDDPVTELHRLGLAIVAGPSPLGKSRGAEVYVSPARATQLEKRGIARRVRESKLGALQRALLVYLLAETERALTEREAERQIDGVDVEGERVAAMRRLVFEAHAPQMDELQLPITRVRWSGTAAMRALGGEFTKSPVSNAAHALAKLEERGLLFRDQVRQGSQRRTTSVELTEAGVGIGKELRECGEGTVTLNIDER